MINESGLFYKYYSYYDANTKSLDFENMTKDIENASKNSVLYGERTGNLCILCDSEFESQRVISQLSKIAESLYFSPPLYSAQLISTILNSPELKSEWVLEIKEMSERIIKTRSKLCEVLKQKRSLHD